MSSDAKDARGIKSEPTEGRRILWTLIRRLGMVVVLIIAFVLSAVITIYLIFRTGATRVPAIVGKSQSEAQSIAERAGLRVRVQVRPDSTVPKDTVIETRPVQNSSVKKDSTLVIVVSGGSQPRASIIDQYDNLPDADRGSWFQLGSHVWIAYTYDGIANARILTRKDSESSAFSSGPRLGRQRTQYPPENSSQKNTSLL